MPEQSVSGVASVLAGLLSFFSPCILPLIPVYLGYMTGTALGAGEEVGRFRTLTHALLFAVGFGAVFVALGAAAGWVGSLLYSAIPVIMRIGGLVLVVFGLHMTGLVSIPFLQMERRLALAADRPRTYWTSVLVGIVFAAGWTPCVGPVLASILFLAADSQTASAGAGLLALYSLGLGVPFLMVAALIDVAAPVLRKLNRHAHVLSVVSGAVLLVMGVLLLTGLFDRISSLFNAWVFS
ncbi:MAG: cytochrome c biogenesis CcdA family protein [Anaerolineae bacterium]